MASAHRSAICVVVVVLLAGTMTVVGVTPEPQAQSAQAGNAAGPTTTISVSASGDAEAEPDVAVLNLEARATGDDPQTATERLATNVSQLRTSLLEAGLSEDQVRTTGFNVFEASNRGEPRPASEETRYVAQQRIAVDVENTSRVGSLLDIAVANGATGVQNVEFGLSEDTEAALRNQALEAAMGSARTQAETLAASENLEITGVRSISSGADGPRPLSSQGVAAARESGTQIDAGPVTVRASVRVTYNATR